MLTSFWLIMAILVAGAVVSVRTRKLTMLAGITGVVTGLLIFAGAGYTGILMLAAFFLLGTAATSWGMRFKQTLGLAEADKGKRTTGQVVANAGVAALLGLAAVAFPSAAGYISVMLAASLASATADTLSSELGNVFGTRFYNIVTFKKDTRGLDGVVSFEGTLIGIAGSACIAVIYAIGYKDLPSLPVIIVAGTVGNLCDSLLGATLERKAYLNNNAVNFLNTAVAAVTALLMLIMY